MSCHIDAVATDGIIHGKYISTLKAFIPRIRTFRNKARKNDSASDNVQLKNVNLKVMPKEWNALVLKRLYVLTEKV